MEQAITHEPTPTHKVELESGIKVGYSRITVDAILESLNPNKLQAQLRQTVTKIYPTARFSNEKQDTLDLGIELPEGSSYETKRVAWIDLPNHPDVTPERVQAEIDKLTNPVIYKSLSNDPIFTENQIRWANNENREDYETLPPQEWLNERAHRQMVRNADQQLVARNGTVLMSEDEDGVQFSRNFFSKTFKQDEDNRRVYADTPMSILAEAEASIVEPDEVYAEDRA